MTQQMITVEKRQEKLRRTECVNRIESESLTLGVEQDRKFTIIDAQALALLRIRFTKIKKTTGLVFTINSDGNDVTITRKA